MDDAHDGREHLAVRRRRGRYAAQPEQAFSPGRGFRHSDPHLGPWHDTGLRHWRIQAPGVPLFCPHVGAPVNCEYRNTILKVGGVSLTLGRNVILRDLNLEIRDLYRPGYVTG